MKAQPLYISQAPTPEERERFEDALRWIQQADKWDSTLWDAAAELSHRLPPKENGFNGDVPEFNRAFERGLHLALQNPDYFLAWHDGFIEGLGTSIYSMVERLEEALEEEEDA